MKNVANFCGTCRYKNDCSCWIFTKCSLFIHWHSVSSIHSAEKDHSCSFIALYCIVFVMNNFKEEVSISEKKLDLIRVNLVKPLCHILYYFIALRDLVSSDLKHRSINLFLEKLTPELLCREGGNMFVKLISWKPSIYLILNFINSYFS